MRIYAVADIHGNMDRLQQIQGIVLEYQPDVLVLAGDTINYICPAKTFEFFNSLAIPVLGVRGNSDPIYIEKYFHHYSNLTSLHLKRITRQSIPFVGMSGTIPLPFRNRIAWRESHLMKKLISMIDTRTVLVAHTPPWGVLDQVMGRFHSGSKMLRSLIEQKQPRLLICGHIHEAAGVAEIGNTTVVNCSVAKTGKGMMIEIVPEIRPTVERV